VSIKLVDREIEQCRFEAHKIFDQLWDGTRMSRGSAYLWLAKSMSIPEHKCHIANFNQNQCEQVIILCEKKLGIV